MKKNNTLNNAIAVIQIITGVLLAAAVKTFASPCSGMLKLENGNETYMKCHYTGLILFYMAILLVVVGIAAFLTKQISGTGILACVLGLLMIVVVGNSFLGVGVCANISMACGMTAGFAKICGGISVIVGIFAAVKGFRK